MPVDGDAPLSDLRVLDVSSEIAGPYCAKMLGDYGADVIKVESPGGDVTRTMEPFLDNQPGPDRSGFFAYLNSNKRGITLNLDTAEGQTLFKALASKVDVVVESFHPGYLDKRGIGFAALEAARPGLILTSITPYGQDGPWRDHEGNDLTAFSVAMWANANRLQGLPPLKGAGFAASFIGGTFGVIGTVGAVLYRDKHGVGQQVDIAIVEALASLAPVTVYNAQVEPASGGRRSVGPRLTPVGDGVMSLSLGLTHFYDQAWLEFGVEDLDVETARTMWYEGRTPELMQHVAATVKHRDKYDLFFKLAEMQCPAGMALTTKDLFTDPHLRGRGYWVEVDQPGLGHIEVPGASFKMSESPYSLRRPAPRLGEHTAEVLHELLGRTPADVEALARAGTV